MIVLTLKWNYKYFYSAVKGFGILEFYFRRIFEFPKILSFCEFRERASDNYVIYKIRVSFKPSYRWWIDHKNVQLPANEIQLDIYGFY